MFNGRLKRVFLNLGVQTERRDLEVYAKVYRVDVFIEGFFARIATTVASSEAARARQTVIGDPASRMYVAQAPRFAAVKKADEVWVGDDRYLVVAVDSYPHAKQLIMREIQ